MSNPFENISKIGFILHNGGLDFRAIDAQHYEFRAQLSADHMNAAGFTHGGWLMSMLDAGMGSAAHRAIDAGAATIAFNVNMMGASRVGETILGRALIKRQTRSLVFVQGELMVEDRLLATAEGVWKIIRPSGERTGG